MDCRGSLPDREELSLSDCMRPMERGRENLGAELPVAVYRMLEYSFREELAERFGKEEQIRIFRAAGYRAGVFFAQNHLDLSQEFSAFVAQLQRQLEELRSACSALRRRRRRPGRWS